MVISLLPTHSQVGLAAPILLVICRAVQRIAVGGEWGGVLFLSEHSERKNRVASGAWAQQGAPAGNILAGAVFLIAGGLLDE